jgi:hypothetical protein
MDVVRNEDGSVHSVYVPVRAPAAEPVRIAFQYHDVPSGAALTASVWQGSLRVGDDISAQARPSLARALGAAPDFVVLEIGSTPSMGWGSASMIGGLIGLAFLAFVLTTNVRAQLHADA